MFRIYRETLSRFSCAASTGLIVALAKEKREREREKKKRKREREREKERERKKGNLALVRNGILLVEFADLMVSQGMEVREAVIEAGRTRMTPVLLTATATMLGLIPLAVGLNLDFVTLFTEFNPHLYFWR
ncbi:efflux RND transporter permease subunit [Pedobacter steynii]